MGLAKTYHGKRFRIGRLQFGYHVYLHTGRLPDRWVIQPYVIYDRKEKRS